jgi:N-methylhydantoinase A
LHAVAVAREIGIRTVIVPAAPGEFSAFGMLFSDLRYDFVRTWFTRLEDAPFDAIEGVYRELENQGRKAIAGTSVKPRSIAVKRAADMRYVGQEHAVTVDLPLRLFAQRDRAAIKRQFDAMHERRYGTSAPDERAEVVSLRSTVTGTLRKPPPERIKRGKGTPKKAAMTGRRKVYFDGAFRPMATYDRAGLCAGNRISGPALIEEHASTTVVLPGDRLAVDAYGNLRIEVAGGRPSWRRGRG